ncbi:MAG: sulfotransferase domain-containing protein [Microcystaceae cyanobacterium]
MLVVCCGMMRSGSTLQYQIAVSIVEKAGKGSGLGEIRQVSCSELEKNNIKNEIQVVKVHKFEYLKGAKEAIEQGKAVGLYSFRDIRDVTVSLMVMRKTDFDRLIFHNPEIQQCLKDFYAWTSIRGMMISQYEVIVNNLTEEVLKIANHLKVDLSVEDAQAIANEYSIKKQRVRIKTWKERSGKNTRTHEPKTLLHYNHINSGQSQQWVNALTPLQIAYLENMAGDWLQMQGYSLSQPLYIHWASQLVFSRYELMRKIERLKHHWQHHTLNATLQSKLRQIQNSPDK